MVPKLSLNASKEGWSQLAQGTARLLRFRGVSRYQSVFESEMLDSQLGFLVGHRDLT